MTQATLCIATGCQHCPVVLKLLGEMVKSGELSRLEVINISQDTEYAQQHNIRSVPWVRIGPFELTGLRGEQEFRDWISKIDDPAAMGQYFEDLMTSGEIDRVRQLVEENPDQLFPHLLHLMSDDNTSLSARIGVGALMEDFANTQILSDHLAQLGEYTRHANARVRNDACYYLGLSLQAEAKAWIDPLLNDEDNEVREVAQEALDMIRDAQAGEA